MRPLALRDSLVLKNVGDQLVVYDQKRRRLHVLSRSAALVWQHCDGHRDLAQLADIVGRKLGAPADDDVIRLALQQLNEANLLNPSQKPSLPAQPLSRREMVSRALGGLAAGVLMPVVTSCGSIVDSTMGLASRSDIGVLVVTTTTATSPINTTSTSPSTSTTGTSTSPSTSTTGTSTSPSTSTTGTSTSPSTSTTGTTPPATTTTTTTAATTTTLPPKKVRLCHNGKTIEVDSHAVAAHLAHGDTLGPCPK